MPVGSKWVQHAGRLFRLADCSSASLPHLAREIWGTHSLLVRIFIILLSGPKAHDSSGRDDNSVAGVGHCSVASLRPLQNCHPDRSAAQWRDLLCALRLAPILPGKIPAATNPNHPPHKGPNLPAPTSTRPKSPLATPEPTPPKQPTGPAWYPSMLNQLTQLHPQSSSSIAPPSPTAPTPPSTS